MSKNVQIPEALFFDLCKYFLLDIKDDDIEMAIKMQLNVKVDKMARRSAYVDKLYRKHE